jgi:hypothetical protein
MSPKAICYLGFSHFFLNNIPENTNGIIPDAFFKALGRDGDGPKSQIIINRKFNFLFRPPDRFLGATLFMDMSNQLSSRRVMSAFK